MPNSLKNALIRVCEFTAKKTLTQVAALNHPLNPDVGTTVKKSKGAKKTLKNHLHGKREQKTSMSMIKL